MLSFRVHPRNPLTYERTPILCIYYDEYKWDTVYRLTNDLYKRVWEHKNDAIEGFTRKYQCHKLVYFEETSDVKSAIAREKQIKGWGRKKKEVLIKTKNPHWKDLSKEWE